MSIVQLRVESVVRNASYGGPAGFVSFSGLIEDMQCLGAQLDKTVDVLVPDDKPTSAGRLMDLAVACATEGIEVYGVDLNLDPDPDAITTDLDSIVRWGEVPTIERRGKAAIVTARFGVKSVLRAYPSVETLEKYIADRKIPDDRPEAQTTETAAVAK